MRREIIAQAITITTGPGDTLVNPYLVASWLVGQGYSSFGLMAEILAYLGGGSEDIDPAILGPIGSIIEPQKKVANERT